MLTVMGEDGVGVLLGHHLAPQRVQWHLDQLHVGVHLHLFVGINNII